MKCTSCNQETDTVRYEHYNNICGVMVPLIPKGEKWCKACCKKNGLKDLIDIQIERKRLLERI